ncbi:hypothetical protein [Gracilibacillus kekensis]|uniref:hypothetical protein n=1 Tax=Gracilibacillus kekensis TaxID=1027249 RepID=UPI00147D5B6E|nr:hypothetical protein [Gracilibacillus kekensis]
MKGNRWLQLKRLKGRCYYVATFLLRHWKEKSSRMICNLLHKVEVYSQSFSRDNPKMENDFFNYATMGTSDIAVNAVNPDGAFSQHWLKSFGPTRILFIGDLSPIQKRRVDPFGKSSSGEWLHTHCE